MPLPFPNRVCSRDFGREINSIVVSIAAGLASHRYSNFPLPRFIGLCRQTSSHSWTASSFTRASSRDLSPICATAVSGSVDARLAGKAIVRLPHSFSGGRVCLRLKRFINIRAARERPNLH